MQCSQLTSIEGSFHTHTFFVRYVKLLVSYEKLRSRRLTGTDLSVGIVTFPCESESILKNKENNWSESVVSSLIYSDLSL